ncbi:MAG TPA: A24 family peptidase [Candidatus Solibacter sp.]|nr:A24 family peptidase [Candidatus Solibacter sp.]
MNLFTLPPRGLVMVLIVLLLTAAVFDVLYRRIPNWLTVSGVLLGIALNAFIGPPEAGLVFSLAGLAVGFGIYAVLYALRAMGAGDVKLMAAVGALVGYQRWFGIFFITALIGGVMALILVVARGRLKKTFFNMSFILSEMKSGRPAYLGNEELDVKNKKALGLPHGAVIAVSTVFYLGYSAYLAR